MKLQMFDINDDELRDRKIKFVEILLLIGGIIGGVSLQKENDPMNMVFGFFLLGSVLYYFVVSNKMDIKTTFLKISLVFSSILTAAGFSGLAIVPFIHNGISIPYAVVILLLYFALTILIFLALYQGIRKKNRK